MAVHLEVKLSELNSSFSRQDTILHAQRSHDLVGDIGHICLEDVGVKDIDYCCSVLFNKNNGILAFLRKTATIDEYQPSKVELLEMLLSFMKRFPGKTIPYAVDIKDCCVSLFSRERFAKVKQNCIPVVIELLKQVSGSKVADDLEIEKLRDKFFVELIQGSSKLTATVKQQLFCVLGVMAEVFFEKMISHSERLLDLCVKALKAEMQSKTKKPEFTVIAGCFQALTHLMVTFTQSAEEGAKHSYDIYKYIKMALDPDVNITRYLMPNSALILLGKHAAQFNVYLIDDYEAMYGRLRSWGNHHNREVMANGKRTLEAFLKQISEMLVTQAAEGHKRGTTFKFFIQQFRSVMDDPSANYKEVNLAIRGYGYFAAPCRLFMSEADVKYMFNEIIQRSEQVYMSGSENLEDKLVNLPSFLEALGSIVRELETVSETLISSMERLVVLLIENYPNFHPSLHYTCHLTLLRTLFALAPKGALFTGFLSRVVYQSLIRTCSHPVVTETEGQEEVIGDVEEVFTADEKRKISYKDYLPMWRILLESKGIKELAGLGIDMSQRESLSKAVYDQLMTSILRILERLDLSSNQQSALDEQAGVSTDQSEHGGDVSLTSDPVEGLQPTRPKDFIVFINLVDFCKDFLPDHQIQMFDPWVMFFGHKVILHTTKLPLVSGFYKILMVCMNVCRKLHYFKGMETHYNKTVTFQVKNIKLESSVKKEEESQDSQREDVDMQDRASLAQKEAAFLLFSKFTKEVLVRMQQFKDDLLASCLALVLALPTEIVIAELSTLVPALKTTLEMGRSYLPLAVAGLDALETWTSVLPPAVIEPYYQELLPCLDAYLRTETDKGDSEGGTVTLTGSSGRRQGKKKLPVKLLKNKGAKAEDTESQLSVVRQRCVYLLGSLGGSVNSVLVQSTSQEIAESAVAWDDVMHLKFDVPFVDIKPVIYFDPFLPRVVDLALTSSERQTKVAACELLHSVVLYMLGRGAIQPGGRGGGAPAISMEALYRKVFPALIKLACDVEQVCKQLFEPLILQMIHWLTGGKRYESEDTMALLDTILDGVVNPTDTTVRDFSARCVREFLTWSIKQSSKKEMEKRPFNVVSLLKRIYSLSKHPSAFKRLGAALAFNNIYTVFREEESLVDLFTFEILHEFVLSLALAHRDDKSLGTADQCKKVLTHLERIIKGKAELLQKTSKKRVCPGQWNEATVLNAIKWLLRQCGRPHTECRHACMELVCKLMPCFEGVSTPSQMFDSLLKENKAKYFITRFEGALYKNTSGKFGITKKRRLSDMGETFTLSGTLNWFDMVLASLDCYCWVFSENLLTPAVLEGGSKVTAMFDILSYFLSELAPHDLDVAAAQYKEHPNVGVFTPHEHDQYNRAKCTLIVRTLNFIIISLGKFKAQAIKVFPSSFWSPKLWDVIFSCVLEPTTLGFNMADVEVMSKLPDETLMLLQVLARYLPADVKDSLVESLRQSVARSGLQTELPLSLQDGNADFLRLQTKVSGYEQLQKAGLLREVLKVKEVGEFKLGLITSVFQGVVYKEDGRLCATVLPPMSLELGQRILKLVFSLDVKLARLMELIFDTTTVQNASGKTSCQGEIFYAAYRAPLNVHLISSASTFIPLLLRHAGKDWSIVGNVLCGMLDHASRDRVLRKKGGAGMVSELLGEWGSLQGWWEKSASQETKGLALALLTKILIVDARVVSDGKHPAFEGVFDMYLGMLTDNTTSLAFKRRVLDLLPFFSGLPEKDTKKLRSKLDRFVADNYPTRSNEYQVGGIKYNDYITSLNKMLSALELSGSLCLLEVLMSVLCREEKHVHEEQIQTSLARFVKRLPMSKQKPAVDIPYSIFMSDSRYSNLQRKAALQRVCLSMLRSVKTATLIEFFTDHVKEIMFVLEVKDNKASEAAMETQIVSKLCCYELVEVMFVRLSRDDVCSKNSAINAAYCGQKAETGKEMAQTVTKSAHQARSEDVRGETVLLELRRQLHCAAYNTAIAVISCVQTDLKFYQGFLFSENTAKGQLLWENIIDSDKIYEFPVEMETPLARRKKFVAIRNEARQGRRGGDNEADDLAGGVTSSVHYLASQYLADSSLSTDISQFDFSSTVHNSAMSSSGSMLETRTAGRTDRRSRSASVEQEPVVNVTDEYVEMEMDPLNQHECMASLTALLQHMKRNGIIPDIDKGNPPSELPRWMTGLRDKIQDSKASKNIKLFLCKLIVNAEEVFRPYAAFWLSPLVHFITSGAVGGEPINYFVTDVVVTVLSWHTTAIPQDNALDRSMATRLCEYLMTHCHHDTRVVLRNSLEVLKTLVEVWRTRIDVPTKIIYDNFTAEKDQKSRRNATGIQMVGVVVANRINPWRNGCGVDKIKFYQFVAMNMLNTQKVVYAATAEVVGMAIKLMEDTEKGSEAQQWRQTYMDNLAKMLMPVQSKQPDQFVTCVYRMQQHYPPIADRFMSKVLFMLPRLHGEFRTHCLEILQQRVEHIEGIFMEMKDKGIVEILSHRNESSQKVALSLVHKTLRLLKPDELLHFLAAVTAFSHSPYAECRAVMYEILMWIYDNYRDTEESEAVNKIMIQTKESLLQGLSDEHLKNRLTVQNFWSDETRLPTDTLERMVAMLEAMYSPATESRYLSYATNLLLEMTSKSPDYNREVFEHPLSECKFEDYQVRSSWKQRHATMAPLFASQSQSSPDGSAMDTTTSMVTQEVRATQDVQQFTPTQADAGSKAPYNWLTQSSLDTFSSEVSLTLNPETQSSLLFTVGHSSKSGSKLGPGQRGKGGGPKTVRERMGKDTVDGGAGSGDSSQILRLKKRFLKDKASSSSFFAKREAKKKQLREQVQQEQKQRRENQVTMYRRYRSGDLPDIQIKYSYLIAPLQALAQRDSTIARLLFSSVFKAIFKEVENVKTERECQEMTKKLCKSLNDALTNSTQYYPPFIGCIMDIAAAYPRKLSLSADVVNTACTTSLQQPLGIILLEETLIQTAGAVGSGDAEERPSKRRRGDAGTANPSATVSKDTDCWVELARLYKSLGDYDVLRGIFSNQLGTQELTSRALDLEMKNDHLGALKFYNEGLDTKWVDAPNEVEMDLWEDSRLQCLDHLTEWDKLQTCTAAHGDAAVAIDDFWEDNYYMEHYFPHMLRSRLKLLMSGDEEQQHLLNMVDAALKLPDRKAVLESQFCEELSLMYTWQEDYNRARHYCKRALQVFLQDWSGLDTLMTASRAHKLQSLQKLTELQEFLEFMSKETNFNDQYASIRLVDRWVKRSPDPIMDTTNTWDDVTSNRCLFIDHLVSRLDGLGKLESGDGSLTRRRVLLRLGQANAATLQDNFSVALKQMKLTRSDLRELKEPEIDLKWTHAYARIQQRRNLVADIKLEDKLNTLSGVVTRLETQGDTYCELLAQMPSLGQVHSLLQGETLHTVIQLLQHNYTGFSTDVSSDIQESIAKVAGCTKKDIQEIINGLVEKGFHFLKASVSQAQHTESMEQYPDLQAISEAHLSLAKYCDECLREKEEEDEDCRLECPSFNTFPTAVITSLLHAMSINSTEARQRFPRLLKIVECYPDTMATFIKQTCRIPCWMFLSWLGQLTALLDKPESPAVQEILLTIAITYPNALVYPFKMSMEGYTFDKNHVGKTAASVCDRLNSILNKNRLISLFVQALEQMGQPNALFKDFTDDCKLLRLFKEPTKNGEKIKAMYNEMYTDLLGDTTESEEDLYQHTQSSLPSSVGKGEYRQQFANKFRSQVEKLCGRDGSKLVSMSSSDFQKKMKEIAEQMNKLVRAGGLSPPRELAKYSKFLAEFQSAEYQDRELEIPGQYTGEKKPLPEYHTKVCNFSEKVMIMSSLRKPKTITIRGNDQKDYKYLVKGGEDLRQDQRIEQIFAVMNQIYSKDPACRSRKLTLRTYQVIPMTPRVGLIEWMENTTPLKEVIYDQLTAAERKSFVEPYQPGNKAQDDHWKMIGGSTAADYHQSYKKYNRTETSMRYRQRTNMVPWDLFRRAYVRMSRSSEALFTLKCNLATSHAQLCISQWLVGIGDRHLSNFMVDRLTGKMVGIDFGHAFGSATQFLPIPELIPFRLTRQIRNVLMPLREKGLLEGTMIHTLHALRKHADLLLVTMDVFIKEPSLDWEQNAYRQIRAERKGDNVTDLLENLAWYPKQKVGWARKKLEGYNPVFITRDELRLNATLRSARTDYERVLLGDKKEDIRARLPQDGLTVEEQVASLMNQATDPNILGRVWIGWEPWM